MFRIKADYSEQLELKTGIEQVRAFFGELRNFAELMPGVESITTEANGLRRWTIRADVPMLGSMRAAFAVELTDDRPEKIEWSPAPVETKNYLSLANCVTSRS